MNFKDFVAVDVSKVFINSDEFGELHDIDGKKVNIVFDENINQEWSGSQYEDGVYQNRLSFFVKAEELGYKPEENNYMEFNGDPYIVIDCHEQMGLYRVTIEGNRT